jgi:hypothetical protein
MPSFTAVMSMEHSCSVYWQSEPGMQIVRHCNFSASDIPKIKSLLRISKHKMGDKNQSAKCVTEKAGSAVTHQNFMCDALGSNLL